MLNDDHFHTETALTQLADPQLYPNDLAWSNRRHVESLGFLFLGALRIGQKLFGSYYDSWPYFTFFFLLVYITGMYTFLYNWLDPAHPRHWEIKRHSIALSLSILSTLPIYMTVTFANWGITSLYAHIFVTIFMGWLFAWLVLALQAKASLWQWLGLGVITAMTIHLNPVKGSGLVGIFGIALFAELLAGRITWRALAGFIGGATLPLAIFLVNYAGNISPIASTPQEFEAAQAFLLEVHRGRIYPWGLDGTLALGMVISTLATAFITLVLYSRRDPPAVWVVLFAAIQLSWGYALMRHPIFLIALGYWWFHRDRLDRWDRLLLTVIAAINIGGPVTSAISQYFWEQHNISAAYTLLYENIRLTRFVMLPVYAILARWSYELLTEDDSSIQWLNGWIVLAMFATITGIFGSANVVKDDAVLIKTMLPLRWAMPLLALGLLFMKGKISRATLHIDQFRLSLSLGIGFFGVIFFSTMRPLLQETSIMGWGILGIGVVWVALLQMLSAPKPYTVSQQQWALFLFILPTLLAPLAGYHKIKPNQNFCDPPFLDHCVPREDVLAAADWLQTNTDKEAIIFVAGLQPERFQPLARRSTVHVNIYQIYLFQGSGALMQALPRYDALQGTNPLREDYNGDSYLFDTLENWNAEAIMIVGGGYTFDLPILYQQNTVVIYAFDPQ